MAANSSTVPASRPPELQDPLNRYLYHPLARSLARMLVPTGVSPNALSVAGMLAVWAAAWAYAAVAWPAGALLGFGLHMAWHVLDGADGHLARLTGKSSPTGEIVDGMCDYSAHIVLYFVLAAILDDALGSWAWVLAVAAGASHIVQTNHAEVQRRSYLWWAYGIPWLRQAEAAGDEVFRERSWFSRMFAWGARDYLKLGNWMAPWARLLDQLVDNAAGDSGRTEWIRGQVRGSWTRALVFEKLVGPNPRTVILGLSMLAGSPLWFFLAEIVLLNAILLLSVRQHNVIGRRLVATFT